MVDVGDDAEIADVLHDRFPDGARTAVKFSTAAVPGIERLKGAAAVPGIERLKVKVLRSEGGALEHFDQTFNLSMPGTVHLLDQTFNLSMPGTVHRSPSDLVDFPHEDPG
jgi:hypothetical protein